VWSRSRKLRRKKSDPEFGAGRALIDEKCATGLSGLPSVAEEVGLPSVAEEVGLPTL
jgi:hypothetical protein